MENFRKKSTKNCKKVLTFWRKRDILYTDRKQERREKIKSGDTPEIDKATTTPEFRQKEGQDAKKPQL